MNRPENRLTPVPGNPDIRRFSVCCDNARRKEIRPGTEHIGRGFRYELYDCESEDVARERFAAAYEYTGDLRVRELDF